MQRSYLQPFQPSSDSQSAFDLVSMPPVSTGVEDGNPQEIAVGESADEPEFVFDIQDWFPLDSNGEHFGQCADLSWLLPSSTHDQSPRPSLEISPFPRSQDGSVEHSVISHGRPIVDGSSPQTPGSVIPLRSPRCGYRVCTALTMKHRQALLLMLGAQVAEIEPTILTLGSLQQGVHLWSRFVAKEYPIVHNVTILEHQHGLQCPAELLWAMITFGWCSLDAMKFKAHRQAASKVQAVLRQKIVSVSCEHPMVFEY